MSVISKMHTRQRYYIRTTRLNETTTQHASHSHKASHTSVTNMVRQRSFIHQFGFSHLGVKELFEHVGTLVVISVRLVEWSAVCEQSCHVGNEQVLVNVIVALQAITYCFQICRKMEPENTTVFFIMLGQFELLSQAASQKWIQILTAWVHFLNWLSFMQMTASLPAEKTILHRPC